MNNDIYLIGEVGYEVTLQTVIDSVEKSDKTKPLTVNIHSGGGGVYDGLAIYNYLKGLDQEVHTKSSGLVASIASIIFLAGKTRQINSTDNFLIHLPSGGAFGNAEDLEKNAEELRDIEGKLSDIYASETDLSKDEAMELMKKDEMMDIDFLKEKGFVDEIVEFKAVANFNNKKMSKETVTKKEVEGLFEKFFNKFFKKEKPTNKVVQDANGVEITFTDLASEDNPAIEDKATVEGVNAKGDYLLPNGNTYTFENGILTAIKEAPEETVDSLKAEIEALKDEMATNAQSTVDKDTELETLTNKIEDMRVEAITLKEKVTGSFNYTDKDKNRTGDGNTQPTSRSLFKVG